MATQSFAVQRLLWARMTPLGTSSETAKPQRDLAGWIPDPYASPIRNPSRLRFLGVHKRLILSKLLQDLGVVAKAAVHEPFRRRGQQAQLAASGPRLG